MIRLTLFEDNWNGIKRFYEDYSTIHTVNAEEPDHKQLSSMIQNEFDSFIAMRERKKQEELEQKRMVEILLKQKQEEEEAAKLRKKAEEEAAKLKAVRLKRKNLC